jgi:3-hydroxyisobutyrate dehydrogenase
MVERSLALGDSVVVWNRTPSKAAVLEAKGARVAASAADAVKGAERVHLTLSDDAAVDLLLAGVVAAMSPQAWLFDHTTTSVAGTRARYARMDQEGFTRFVHAPVFMTPAMAREAKGYILLSGSRERCDSLRPLLGPLTGEVWYVGERREDAAAYKLFGNAMTLIISGGLSDLFAMARGMGLEPQDAVGVFDKMIPGVAGRAARMVKGEFTPASFELVMARKDLRLALEPALASGLPLAVLPALARRFDDVLAAGHANDDYGVIAAEALAPPRPNRAGDDGDPFAQLERCHRRLEERLDALANAPGDAEEEERFFAFLDRSIRRHEDDEEQSLFPRLQGSGELAPVIASLHEEHRAQSERQKRLREAKGETEKARVLGELAAGYRAHIEKEERVLFPAARRALDADATRSLAREMDARRGGGGGGGGRGRRGEGDRGGGRNR